MKVNGFLFLLFATALLLGGFYIWDYHHTMAPTWAEIERKQADFDLSIAKANALADVSAHEQRAEAVTAGSWLLVLLLLATSGVLLWKEYDKRRESRFRAVDGIFPLHSYEAGGHKWVIDPNKAVFGAIGFDKASGSIITDAAIVGPDRQLTHANENQKTRTAAARQLTDIRNSAQAKLAAGYYDRESRQLTQTPAKDDGDPLASEPAELLTLEDAFKQSTLFDWIIGQNHKTGELCTINPKQNSHFGIVGSNGTGKTAYVALLLMAYALRFKFRVIVLDGKGGADWSKYRDFVEYYPLDYSSVGGFVAQLYAEYESRQAILNEAEVNSIWELPKGAIVPRPTMIIADEFGATMDSLKAASKAEYKKVSLDLGNLLRLSRGAGLYFVPCDQNPTRWTDTMRANMPVNVCFRLGGGIGGAVNEYNLDRLDRVGHFQMSNVDYHAWPTYKEIDMILPSIEYKKPKALLTVHSDRSPFTVQSEGGDVGDTPTPGSERLNGERLNEPTDLEVIVWQWRDKHPQGTQAELRKDFERRRIEISKGHVFNCWHSWPNASPTPSDRGGTALDQLRALGYDPDQVRVKGGEKLGIDKTRKPEEL